MKSPIVNSGRAVATASPHRSPPSSGLDLRTLRTRDAIERGFLELLETKPLDQITIRDIAAAARISYVTFFRHHRTKENLLREIAEMQVHRLVELMLPALDASDHRRASLALCMYIDSQRKLWSTLLTGGAAAVLREELLKSSRAVAANRANPHSWVPPELSVDLSVSATIEVLAWWLRQKSPVAAEKVAEIHERLVITPSIEASRQVAPVANDAPRRRD